mgnify:CR=1 FL=1
METKNGKRSKKNRFLTQRFIITMEGILMLPISILLAVTWGSVFIILITETGILMSSLLAIITGSSELESILPERYFISSPAITLSILIGMIMVDICLILGGKQILLKIRDFLRQKGEQLAQLYKQDEEL